MKKLSRRLVSYALLASSTAFAQTSTTPATPVLSSEASAALISSNQAAPVAVAPVEPVAPLTPAEIAANDQFVLALLNQSLGVSTSGINFLNNRVQFGGLVNVDASYWGKPYFGQGSNDHSGTSYLELAEANLNGLIQFNDWVSLQAGALYTNGKSPSVVNFRPANPANHHVALEDAYVTVANFQKMPVYFQAGQMFVPFGRYQRYPITQTLTQILTQTDLPTIQAGWMSQTGVVLAAYGVSGEHKVDHSNSNGLNDYGVTLGYENRNHAVGYDFGISYLNNMNDVDAMREIARKNQGYGARVGGMNLYGDIFAGPFGFSARYVSALKRFDAADYQETHNGIDRGAKPIAADFNADYKFKTLKHPSMVNLTYQLTRHAHNTSASIGPDNVTRLPLYRWGAGYGVNLVKDLALYIQYYQDKNYQRKDDGNNKRDNVVTARLSFLF